MVEGDTVAGPSGVAGNVPRPELVAAIIGHDGPVLIVAGAGSGKSTLAVELAAESTRPVIDIDIEVGTDTGEPDFSAHGDLVDPIILTRTDPGPAFGPSALVLHEDDIWFSQAEVERVLDSYGEPHPANPALALAIHRETGGWPTAVSAIATLIGNRPQLRRRLEHIVSRGPHLAEPLRQALQAIEPDTQSKLAQLARLPFLAPEMVSICGPLDSWQALRVAGLPFRLTKDGFYELPAPVRTELIDRAPVDDAIMTDLGQRIADALGLEEALRALVEAEAWTAAQAVLLATPELTRMHGLGDDVLGHLRRLVESVQPEPEPRTMLTMAQLSLRAGLLRTALDDVARCQEVAGRNDDPVTDLRAQILGVELSSMLDGEEVASSRLDVLEATQAEVGSSLSALELAELRFRVLSARQDVPSLSEAARLAVEAAQTRAAAGDPKGGAELYRANAVGPLFTLGRYRQLLTADRVADQMAQELVPSERSLVFRAVVTALAGDLGGHQQAITSQEQLYERLSASWLEAYVWGAKMIAASLSGSRAGVINAFQRLEQSIGDLAETITGISWLAMAAEAHALVDELDVAFTLLDRLRPRRHELPARTGMATVVVNARAGRLDRAGAAYQEMLDADVLAPERRWRADLEFRLAVDPPDATAWPSLDDIIAAAREAGCQNLLRELLSRSPRHDQASDATVIKVFGGLRVSGPSGMVDPGPGRPADLIKMLVLGDGHLHVDTAIEGLWPDSDVASGRRRLKNVVSRARTIVGPGNLRRSADLLVLSDEVEADLFEFRRYVASARAAPSDSDEFMTSARRVLEIARFELLPNDRYADWLADDRWQIESVITTVFEEFAATATNPADLDWLLAIGQELDHLDRSSLRVLARNAEAIGLDTTARLAQQLADQPDEPSTPGPEPAG